MRFFENLKNNFLVLFIFGSTQLFSQEELTFLLGNPQVSGNNIKWEIFIQNTSKSGEIITLSTANLPVSCSADIATSSNNSLSIDLSEGFDEMSFVPQVMNYKGKSFLRLNGGEPPLIPPTVSNMPVKFGTVSFKNNGIIKLKDFKIEFSRSVPNVNISGFVNGIPRTFSLANSNLILKNMAVQTLPDLSSIEKHRLDFTVFPNPTTNLVHYNIVSEDNIHVQEISVLDAQGRVVMLIINPGQLEGSIDMTSYAPGVYYLMVKQNENISHHKIIKI